MNWTSLEKVRCMLSNAGLGKEFWAESAIEGKTPIEVWFGKPANDYDSLHVFGSTAYFHVKESKLDPRAQKALYMGLTVGVKGYRLWCLDSKKIILSRDVTFDESIMLKQEKQKDSQVEKMNIGASQQVELEITSVDPVSH
ncbi:hypothetical protein LWI29_033348 [Acer saccharum]|uniref:Retroviral polymerase SH3-like domain-containing protein n=1 Tax=Acer saccharum TaxID=4024 RepID=A0AA39SYJ9_ACESA|nr:hypothetical protein LWI29_033348 [Acer saccharum]